ncbi:MAG: transglycosylase SLT domain-containing protein, partial [Bdellovibrionales bacterium]|nr:transglycosylase SLT domain-containing protein [Bdellovibrionales bacterium]
WLERETPHKRDALENASMHFDKDDKLTVNTLEAIYGQESSFGKNRRKRYIDGAAGDFQLEKKTAKRMGLTISSKNDPRFDIDDASAAAAKYLKTLDSSFSKSTTLSKNLNTIPVSNASKRVRFAIAAYNAGEGRIAKAQKITKESGGDPNNWDEVKENLEAAGASAEKAKEIREYVEKVTAYEKEFSKKSKANKRAKHKKAKKIKRAPEGGHWVTIKGRHIFIEDKR